MIRTDRRYHKKKSFSDIYERKEEKRFIKWWGCLEKEINGWLKKMINIPIKKSQHKDKEISEDENKSQKYDIR